MLLVVHVLNDVGKMLLTGQTTDTTLCTRLRYCLLLHIRNATECHSQFRQPDTKSHKAVTYQYGFTSRGHWATEFYYTTMIT